MKFVKALIAATGIALFVAAPASATTFCVGADGNAGNFFAACPNNGTNVAEDLEDALDTQSNDGVPDKVILEAGTHTDTTFSPNAPIAADPVEVTGAGRAATTITSSSGGNVVVLDFSLLSNRPVTMKDLRITAPSTFPDTSGHALYAFDINLQRVDFESRNPGDPNSAPYGTEGAKLQGATNLDDVRFYGTGGGSFGTALSITPVSPGLTVKASKVKVEASDTGLATQLLNEPDAFTIDRSSFDVYSTGLLVGRGMNPVMTNSVVRTNGGPEPALAVYNSGGSQDANLDIRNSTIVNTGPEVNSSAIFGGVENMIGSTGNVNVLVADSIIRGFQNTWLTNTPGGNPTVGDVNLEFHHSNFRKSGSVAGGDTNLDTDDGTNIDQDPQFTSATDFHLKPGSPSIDKGNPAAGGLLTDFDGAVRPVDGNGDGTKVRDQGAFEYHPPKTCANDPSLCPKPQDTVKPKVTKVKFKSPKGKKKKGFLKLTLSEKAKVTATFKPVPKGKGKKKRRKAVLKKAGRKGANKFVLKKGKLKKGRYRLTISARDAAGNKSAGVRKTVRVR